jgi:CMD domain protein
MSADIIDRLAGLEPGSRLATIRDGRQQARENAQASFQALFAPAESTGVSPRERAAIAFFIAGLHQDAPAEGLYREHLAEHGPDLVDVIAGAARAGATTGPYGAFPEGSLSVEDKAGLHFRIAPEAGASLGRRLAAALEHAHLLVFRPRDAKAAALQALIDASWSSAEIVTLSQLVAFLAFQIRSAAGLRVLAAS